MRFLDESAGALPAGRVFFSISYLFLRAVAILCLLLFACLALSDGRAEGPTSRELIISVGTEKLGQTPMDRNICGAVLEHIGQQIDVMWAELLHDHSFEGIPAFAWPTENWAEGKIDSRQFWCHVIGGTPEHAADWVEYCNGGERTRYGQMRVSKLVFKLE